MEFSNLRKLSVDLEDNIRFLENSLKDTSMLLYSDEGSEGIQLLQDLHEQWKRICEELEEANKKDGVEIQQICQEFEITKFYFHTLEEKRKEYENILIQKNLLLSEPNDSIPSHFEDSLKLNDDSETQATVWTPHIPQISYHSTPDVNGDTTACLENTISEFQCRKT